ncbi:RND family transporter [Campylobacter sp. MIT 97-5078]|nr:MMPL family transporter [Campylobacter sp. MIT 97-5078]KGI55729.1 membrane protein [Campylobacter sp. MIT 97-5078]TQR27164.1 RND family transporter [Campylobacter sp. MIT 97-5078]
MIFETLFKILIKHAKLTLCISFSICVFLSFFASKLSVDASADSLLLENDEDLSFYRQINERYKSDDFLVIALHFKDENPFSETNLKMIKNLQNELEAIKGVQRILSIINAPLLTSKDNEDLKALLEHIPSLADENINKSKARTEILNSPFYQNNIISKDGKITALIVYFEPNLAYLELIKERQNATNEVLKAQIQNKLDLISEQNKLENKTRLDTIKAITSRYEKQIGTIYLGGVSMIADDMISYIKADLWVYGVALSLLLMLVLWLFFRKFSFVFLALLTCFVSLSTASGVFALLGFKITVISSNYLAFMLIISISLIIHLITHFIHLNKKFPKANSARLTLATLLAKLKPSFYAILTTAIGFLSLIFSNIEPIIKLGIMMSIGISISLVLSLVFFACLMPFFASKKLFEQSFNFGFLAWCANFSFKRKKLVFLVSAGCLIIAFFGILQLRVENSFVNYFKESSEIKKGLLVIDEYLGGTMPLEVVLRFQNKSSQATQDSFEDEFNALAEQKTYFFSADKMRLVKKVHDYFTQKEFVGSTLSLNSLLILGKSINEGKDLDDFALAFLYENLPLNFKDELLNPFVNVDENELRFVMRIKDSDATLQRNEFLKSINEELGTLLQGEALEFRLSGIMLLYNNMLQSLFASQFNTLAFVIIAIFVLFVLVFKSFKLALVGILANIIPLSLVFAFMGFLGLSLDLMSITIAAICIGIGVDDSIHYIYRFKEELGKKSLQEALIASHLHIGSALFQSKVAIILGFSVMMSSNFIPTIYFGFLTLIVMILLLLGSLILLPSLLSSLRVQSK